MLLCGKYGLQFEAQDSEVRYKICWNNKTILIFDAVFKKFTRILVRSFCMIYPYFTLLYFTFFLEFWINISIIHFTSCHVQMCYSSLRRDTQNKFSLSVFFFSGTDGLEHAIVDEDDFEIFFKKDINEIFVKEIQRSKMPYWFAVYMLAVCKEKIVIMYYTIMFSFLVVKSLSALSINPIS